MRHGSAFACLSLTAAICLVFLGTGCGDGAQHEARRVDDPSSAVLRVGDMPRGYREGSDTTCGLATTEGDEPQLQSLFSEERPKACIVELDRVWSGGNHAGVTSAAYVFHDAAGAERALGARRPLLEYTASVSTQQTQTVHLADDARLVLGRGLNAPAAAVIWRSGNVVGVLAVEPADPAAALELARRQEQRIAGTAPAPRSVDTLETELDDPALKLPVYWLGRSFDPPGPLPKLDLTEATVLSTGPGDTVKLDYGGVERGRVVGVTLDLWEPAAWKRFSHTRLGRLVWDSSCARKTPVRLPDGRAEIFEGYGTRNPLQPPCPARPPDRVLAHVYLPGVVVAVDMPYCYACASGPTRRNPYETITGMTAIARGLAVRR